MKDIILFTSANNETQVEVQFEKETFWLSKSQIT